MKTMEMTKERFINVCNEIEHVFIVEFYLYYWRLLFETTVVSLIFGVLLSPIHVLSILPFLMLILFYMVMNRYRLKVEKKRAKILCIDLKTYKFYVRFFNVEP